MGSEISLFSGYSQKENRTTNYCLLVLKLLYEENPKFLGEVLAGIVGEDLADVVGVQFRQQVRKKNSVPDGVVSQRAFTLYIETKNWDWFKEDHLQRHLDQLDAETPGTKVLIALSNFESLAASRFAGIEELCRTKYKGSVFFKAVTFEELVEALPEENVSKNLRDTLEEFEEYLDEQGLLPRWKTRLDVVNCSGLPAEVTEGGVYMCPARGGPYKHARAKYFGMYCISGRPYVTWLTSTRSFESTKTPRRRSSGRTPTPATMSSLRARESGVRHCGRAQRCACFSWDHASRPTSRRRRAAASRPASCTSTSALWSRPTRAIWR
jgi:hypothetical protein